MSEQLPAATDGKQAFPTYMKKVEALLGRKTTLVEQQRAKNHYSYGRKPSELVDLIARGARRAAASAVEDRGKVRLGAFTPTLK